MAAGLWPLQVIGRDVTYLVNYFRDLAEACIVNGFYCPADVNGDCLINGSDVTFLVNYFRGLNSIFYCPDFETTWPTPSELPVDEPVGWPNCEIPVSMDR